MPADFTDLSAHTNALVALLSVVAAIAGFFFWRWMGAKFSRADENSTRVETKLDQWLEIHEACKLRQETERKELVKKMENGFKDIAKERKKDWRRYIWPHTHNASGDMKVPKVLIEED